MVVGHPLHELGQSAVVVKIKSLDDGFHLSPFFFRVRAIAPSLVMAVGWATAAPIQSPRFHGDCRMLFGR